MYSKSLTKFSGIYTKEMLKKGLITEDMVNTLSQFDPTPNKKYLDWMVKIYIKEGSNVNLDNLRNYIEEFDILAQRGIDPQYKDIYRFKTFAELENFILQSRQREHATVKELENDYEVIADNDKVFIVVPYTHEASRKLGFKYFVNAATGQCEWCTTHKNMSFWQSHRNKQAETLYYIHIKDPKIQKMLQGRSHFDLENIAIVVFPNGRLEGYDNFDKLVSTQVLNKVVSFINQEVKS